MRLVNNLRLRLRSLFRRSHVEQELNTELQFHLEQQIEENLAAGMSREEAQHAAQRTFGNVASLKEQARDTWGLSFLTTLWQDISYGVRTLSQSAVRSAAERWTARGGSGRDRLARYLDRRGFSKAAIVEILSEFAGESGSQH